MIIILQLQTNTIMDIQQILQSTKMGQRWTNVGWERTTTRIKRKLCCFDFSFPFLLFRFFFCFLVFYSFSRKLTLLIKNWLWCISWSLKFNAFTLLFYLSKNVSYLNVYFILLCHNTGVGVVDFSFCFPLLYAYYCRVSISLWYP